MRLFSAFILLFLTIFTSGIAGAQDLTINPCDQGGINAALQSVYSSGGGVVHLNPGVYTITGQVQIGSNTRLEGDPNAIIQVSSSSSQWFTDGVGIIGAIQEPLNNVEISGFQIEGNCQNFPREFANSGAGNHNAHRAIDLRASTGEFSNNISIHDIRICDFYSDGIHIAFAHSVFAYNNILINCQHDATFYVDCTGEIYNNHIEGLTDDCIRFDNCPFLKIHDNFLTSYQGNHNNGYFKDGANGIQGGDEGFSHGGGSDKPDYVDNVEIYNNVIQNMGLAGIQLDTVGKNDLERVYIHHNTIVNCGYESNAAWGSGISLSPWVSGVDIENNVFDGCYQASILVLGSIGQATASIRNNNILNTRGNGQASSGGLSSSIVGYGIYSATSAMALDVAGNYFSGNLKGDCSELMENTVSAMVPGAGGNGASIIGNLPGVPNVDQSGATVPETITNIFDILKMQFTGSGYVDQSNIVPAIQWENKGLYTSAWIDVPAYNNTIRIGNDTYINGSPIECAYVMCGASSSASYPDYQDVSKTLTVEPDNKLKIDLSVKTGYKVPEKRHIKVLGFTLNQTIYKKQSEIVTFSKTFDTPKQYPVLNAVNFNVSIVYQNNSYNPHTLVYISSPYQNLISQVHYSYNGSYADYFYSAGQVKTDSKGAKVTVFHNLDTWKVSDDNISYSYGGAYLKGKFNLSQLNVTIKTPYSDIDIKNFNYIEQRDPTDNIKKSSVIAGLCIAFLIPLLFAIIKELSFVIKRGI